MTTGLQVFDIAMGLSDNLTNGLSDTSENAEYKARTLHIINNYLPELYPYSDTYTSAVGVKPVPTFISDLTDILVIDDSLARGVLPHGVISMLFISENPELASVHEQKYFEKLALLKNTPRDSEDIEDIYYDYRMQSGVI